MSELLRAIVPAEMMNMDGFFQARDAGEDDLPCRLFFGSWT